MATRRYSFVLFASLFVAAIATFLVFRYINASTARNQIATMPVVVAAKDIGEGEEIQEADVRVEQWPEPVVPENAFEAAIRVSGRVSRVPIYAGEAIVPGRLAPEGASPGLEAKISAGKRAMGVRINDVSGMKGMIQPNSRVDILLVLPTNGGESRSGARLFMENMRVLATDAAVTRAADGRPVPSTVVMIEVTPEESELLAAAQSRGQIQLVLRGFAEQSDTRKVSASSAAAMLREGAPAPVAPSPRPSPRVTPPPQRPAEPVAVPVAPPVVKAPAATRPDSVTVQVWRGKTKTDEKLTKDTTKRDTIRPPT